MTPSQPLFIGRAKEIRRILSRLRNGGQSVGVYGEPRIGKTSLLLHLQSQIAALPAEENAPQWLLTYLDAQTFGTSFTPAQFWQAALAPLRQHLQANPLPSLAAAYEAAQKDNFGAFGLERLLAHMQPANLRLVLLLDEFDNLLALPSLHKAEFYGSLRSLASRLDSLALVISSRQSLEALNQRTQEYSQLGSPYFNFLTALPLGALEEKEARQLLDAIDPHYTKEDREFLRRVAGAHPYLLRIAADALRDAYEDEETNAELRYANASRDLYETLRPSLAETWNNLNAPARQAIALIALEQAPKLAGGREFDLDTLFQRFGDYRPEVEDLLKRGFLAPDASHPRSGYRLQAQVMVWWLSLELTRVTRPQEKDTAEMLGEQEWQGILKGNEKAQLRKALLGLGKMLPLGIETFLTASLQGAAKRWTGTA